MSDDKNLYMCAIYIPPDKNVFYRKYECDIFDVLQEEIELYSVDGNVAVIGDLNGRVGKEPDQILRREDLHSWSMRFPKILGCFKPSVNLSQNISSGTYSIKFAILSWKIYNFFMSCSFVCRY
jgi:hypothetical protein